MAAPLEFTANTNLGTWAFYDSLKNRSQMIAREIDFSLTEKVELTFFKVNPYTGVVDANTQLTCQNDPNEVYASLLKTKPDCWGDGTIKPLFIPIRTHTVRDLIGDLFIPLNRREVFEKKSFSIIDRINYFISEVLTLIARLFTCIPTAIYNHFCNPDHPARTYFPEEEAVFVACKKTWTLNAVENDQSQELATLEGTFNWRVDFFAPLQSTFEWNRKCSALDYKDLQRNVAGDETFYQKVGDFENTRYEGHIPIIHNPDSPPRHLYMLLEYHVSAPIVTFC